MTTWTQDYPALPGSAHAAAKLAHTVAYQHLPGRAVDAHKVVAALFAVGLAKSSSSSILNLITQADGQRVRFELYFPNDQTAADDTTAAYQSVSALADSAGEKRTGQGRGRMMYAELWRRNDA